MKLQDQIAECNDYPEPLMAFINRTGYINIRLINDRYTSCFGSYSGEGLFRTTSVLVSHTVSMLDLDWLKRQATTHSLHPVVNKLIDDHGGDWYGIMLEWPHISEDGERLAYTRNATAGINNRVTVTSLGKYLAKWFPELSDHVLRDAAALFTPDKFEMRDTVADIVDGVQNGPHSCMRWVSKLNIAPEEHPYSCYAPENGWTLAVRITGTGRIDGRCLCHTKDDKKIFVRSFARDKDSPDNGYSHSDTALEAWLKEQGYLHKNEWAEYCQLDTKNNTLYPYIDGNVQTCDGSGFITEDGDYGCDNTDGTAGSANIGQCSECDERITEDDIFIRVGPDEDSDELICGNCDHNYTYALGRNGHEYYVHDDNVIYVDGNPYHDDYMHDNDIVELKDGNYAKDEDVVCVDDEYYLVDDRRVVQIDDEYYLHTDIKVVSLNEPNPDNGDKYALEDDVWYCAETGNCYHRLIEPVVIDDETYHADSAAASKQIPLELEPS